MTDIVVLDHKIHGLSASDYVETLRDTFPNQTVVLAQTTSERETYLQEATVATGIQIDEELVERSDTLETFMCTFAGTDHLPTDTLKANNVTVESASGVHGPNISEQVLGYILGFVRRLDRGVKQEQRHEWNHYQAGELSGSTATVVGLGPIGQTIIDRLNAFDVETIGVRYTPSKGGPADRVIGFDQEDIEPALTETDHLVLATPLTDETEHLITDTELTLLPTHATVTNVARGKVIDTEALVSALQTNDIRWAALDVTDPEPLPRGHPLWDLQNCRITPHNAGHTPNYWDRCSNIIESVI